MNKYNPTLVLSEGFPSGEALQESLRMCCFHYKEGSSPNPGKNIFLLRYYDGTVGYVYNVKGDNCRLEIFKNVILQLNRVPLSDIIHEVYQLPDDFPSNSISEIYDIFEDIVEEVLPGLSGDARFIDKTLFLVFLPGTPACIHRYYVSDQNILKNIFSLPQ